MFDVFPNSKLYSRTFANLTKNEDIFLVQCQY